MHSAPVWTGAYGARLHSKPAWIGESQVEVVSMLNRRTFVLSSMLGSVATLLPRIPFAATKTDARFVLVILRGALDGLAAVPAYGDGSYAGKRGALAITSPSQ